MNLVLAAADSLPQERRHAEPGQKGLLPLGPLVQMMLCWSQRERRWMRRLHQAQRDARGCAEGDALESQSPHHDRRRMLDRVNLGSRTQRSL